jgi:hypothetical protein
MVHAIIDLCLTTWCVLTNLWTMRQGRINRGLRKVLYNLSDNLESIHKYNNLTNEAVQKLTVVVQYLKKELDRLTLK